MWMVGKIITIGVDFTEFSGAENELGSQSFHPDLIIAPGHFPSHALYTTLELL
jgi:hypothetical protein